MTNRFAALLWLECHAILFGHDFSRHGGGPVDPVWDPLFRVFLLSAAILIVGGAGVGLIGGSLLMYFTGRVRHLFWAIPGANLLLYLLVLFLRPYPGGFWAQFYWPGLIFTFVEIVGLLLLSVLLAALLILGRLLYRGVFDHAYIVRHEVDGH